MPNSTSFRLFYFAFIALALPLKSMAVETGPAISSIWVVESGGAGEGLGKVDYMDTIPGQETLAVSYLLTTTSPDAFGKIKVRTKEKVAIRKANGPLVANLQPMQIVSQPFPDPCDTDNQSGGTTQTWYTEEWLSVFAYPSPSCAEDIANFFDDQGTFNAAIGNSAGDRTLMFGRSIVGGYYNSIEDGEISVYKFFSYDADDHGRLCTLTFDGEDENGWELFPEFSGVGPYLGGSDDVLRVTREKDTATEGRTKFKNEYYDIRSCELIESRIATSPAF